VSGIDEQSFTADYPVYGGSGNHVAYVKGSVHRDGDDSVARSGLVYNYTAAPVEVGVFYSSLFASDSLVARPLINGQWYEGYDAYVAVPVPYVADLKFYAKAVTATDYADENNAFGQEYRFAYTPYPSLELYSSYMDDIDVEPGMNFGLEYKIKF